MTGPVHPYYPRQGPAYPHPHYQMQNPDTVESLWVTVKNMVRVLSMAVVMLLLVYILVIYGTLGASADVYRNLGNIEDYLFILLPIPPYVFAKASWQLSQPLGVGAFYTFCLVSILLSGLYMGYKHGPSLLGTIKRLFTRGEIPPVATRNGIVETVQLYLAILFFTAVWYMAVRVFFQSDPIAPEGITEAALYQQMYMFAGAAVYEEIVTRIFMLGLPLLLLALAFKDRDIPYWRYMVGGDLPIQGRERVVLYFSALLFGLAHVPGWDMWKLIPSVMAGVAFGYLFLRFSLAAAITLHFIIDYTSIPVTMLGDTSTAAAAVYLLIFIGMVFGAIYFYKFTHRALVNLFTPDDADGKARPV